MKTPISEDVLRRGRELITHLQENPEDGAAYNELLSKFFRGFPVAFLGELLGQPHDAITAGALFIAEELGSGAFPVIDDIISHTANANPRIRSSAFAAVCRVCKGEGKALVHVCRGVLDSDPHCRKTAMLLMMRVPDVWLKGALGMIGNAGVDRDIREGLTGLLREPSQDPSAVQALILDQCPLIRRFGVIAAGRMGKLYPHLLEMAAKSEDADIAMCATEQQRFIALRQRREKGS
jgi:hypothetical protein